MNPVHINAVNFLVCSPGTSGCVLKLHRPTRPSVSLPNQLPPRWPPTPFRCAAGKLGDDASASKAQFDRRLPPEAVVRRGRCPRSACCAALSCLPSHRRCRRRRQCQCCCRRPARGLAWPGPRPPCMSPPRHDLCSACKQSVHSGMPLPPPPTVSTSHPALAVCGCNAACHRVAGESRPQAGGGGHACRRLHMLPSTRLRRVALGPQLVQEAAHLLVTASSPPLLPTLPPARSSAWQAARGTGWEREGGEVGGTGGHRAQSWCPCRLHCPEPAAIWARASAAPISALTTSIASAFPAPATCRLASAPNPQPLAIPLDLWHRTAPQT